MKAQHPSSPGMIPRTVGRLKQRRAGQIDIGMHWLGCGWRVFLRNPWQLGCMGLVCAALVLGLDSVPLLGGSLIALLAPIFLGSAYVAADDTIINGTGSPPSSPLAALKRAPLDLVYVLNDDRRMIPMMVIGICCMAIVVLIGILLYPVTGAASLSGSGLSLGVGSLPARLGMMLLMIVVYFPLAASIVYALPLAFFQEEPLIPAMVRSVRMSLRHVFALLVILGLLPGLYLVGVMVTLWSFWAGCLVWLALGAIVLPLSVTSAYCSFRTVFSRKERRVV
jgi:hypothetical protein